MPVENVIQNCSNKFKRELQKCFNKFAANNLKLTIGAILLYSADCRVTHYSVSVFFYQLAFYLHKIFLFIYTYIFIIYFHNHMYNHLHCYIRYLDGYGDTLIHTEKVSIV